jgi:hypothetical protein
VSDIGKKRLDAILAIATYSIGSGTASSVPSPGGEIPRQLILTASDILMYISVWKIYFQEDLSSQGLVQILAELGLVTISATGTAYIVSKATTAILKEITNWTGPVGWGVTAAIAGSVSGLFGLVWAVYCDRLLTERQAQTP